MRTASPILAIRSVLVSAALVFSIIAAAVFAVAPGAARAETQLALKQDGQWRFAIERGGYRIGEFELNFRHEGPQLFVTTRTHAEVSILGIGVYRLELAGREIWENGRFRSYEAQIYDNGKNRSLKVEAVPGKTLLTVNGKMRELAPGLLPATFWNLELTKHSLVIDPVKGKLRNVQFQDQGMEAVPLLNRSVQGRHVAMTGEIERHIWYAEDGSVLRLDGIAKDGSLVKGLRLP